MTAEALHVDRWRTRCRVTAGSAEHRRIEAVLRTVVGDALERAVERAGVPAGGEVCVRELHPPPVRLALARQTDVALADAWADAIAGELAATIATASPGVVAYGSRRQALVDMALGVAGGDLTRAWAWQALGLWPAAAPPQPHAALLAALAREGDAVVPVLCELARRGRLRTLAARVERAAWQAPAVAALMAAGAAHEPAQSAVLEHARAPESRAPVVDVTRSALAAALKPSPATAALALLDVDPAAVARLGPDLPAAVHAAAHRLRRPRPGAPGDDSAPATVQAAAEDGDRHSPAPPAETSHADTESPLPERARARTRWGGLLFALHGVAELDLPARAPEGLLAPFLHALATALTATEPGDPAALAFAGLPPDAQPPAAEALGGLRSPARRALEPAGVDLRAWLAARLRRAPDRLDLPTLLRRRAEIVADPGWIEVHLDLDEVDLDVRRAGLDLDPGHLPFLGCVVRFVYA